MTITTDIPEGLTVDSVIRLGYVEAPIRTLVKNGMLRQEGGRFFKSNEKHCLSSNPSNSPNPFSLKALQVRGFKVIAGKTTSGDLVMIMPGSYCRITDALRNGLLNETTQPI